MKELLENKDYMRLGDYLVIHAKELELERRRDGSYRIDDLYILAYKLMRAYHEKEA